MYIISLKFRESNKYNYMPMAKTWKYLTLSTTNVYKTRKLLFKLENCNAKYIWRIQKTWSVIMTAPSLVLQLGPHKHKHNNDKANSYECNNELFCTWFLIKMHSQIRRNNCINAISKCKFYNYINTTAKFRETFSRIYIYYLQYIQSNELNWIEATSLEEKCAISMALIYHINIDTITLTTSFLLCTKSDTFSRTDQICCPQSIKKINWKGYSNNFQNFLGRRGMYNLTGSHPPPSQDKINRNNEIPTTVKSRYNNSLPFDSVKWELFRRIATLEKSKPFSK
jgi:hypothetical protein